MRLITRPKKAFSLLELMIVMAVISILMAAAAPGVDRWVSRYRAHNFFAQLISDMASTRLLAYSSRITQTTTSDADSTTQYSQSAIRFTNTNYVIMQRSTPQSGSTWNPAENYNRVIKTVNYPQNITLTQVKLQLFDATAANIYTDSGTPTIFFTPTGAMGDGMSTAASNMVKSTGEICGDVDGAPAPTHPASFHAQFTVVPKLGIPIYYEIHIDQEGTYALCYAPQAGDFEKNGILIPNI